jgi:DNA replication protein DnaC
MEYIRSSLAGRPGSEPSIIAPQAAAIRCATCRDLRVVRIPDLQPGDAQFGKLMPCPDCNVTTPEQHEHFRRGASRLTPGELQHRLDNFWTESVERKQALHFARQMLELGSGWLTLWGGNGSGKSYLATAMVCAALDAGKECRYWLLPKLLDTLRDSYNPESGAESYSDLVETLSTVPLLVVDECTEFNPKPWAREKMCEIVEDRYRHADRTMTIWVCNVNPRNAGGELEALFSRMTEHLMIELRGDFRPQIGEKKAKVLDLDAL